MASITQPLRDEHKELYPQIVSLRQAADVLNESLTTQAHDRIEQAYNFLTRQLVAHSRAEEAALYPIVQKIMGSEQSTATMVRDHVEIARLTEELDSLRVHKSQLTITSIQTAALRRVLYGLYALVKLHFAKEEEIYLPLLDSKLTPEDAHAMFEKMKTAYDETMASMPR
jgi:iron-sulfur cluster repair protein YtfE (RIC family)